MPEAPAPKPTNLTIGPFRVAFPDFFEGKVDDKGKTKWSVTVLIPKKPEFDAIRKQLTAMATEAVLATWPNEATRPRKLGRPIHDGDSGDDTNDGRPKGEVYEGYAGHYYLTATSSRKPTIVDRKKQPITEADKDRVYGGMWLYVNINAYTYDREKKGVTFGLNCAMVAKDDEPFGGGGVSAEAAFASIPAEQQDNGTGGAFDGVKTEGEKPEKDIFG